MAIYNRFSEYASTSVFRGHLSVSVDCSVSVCKVQQHISMKFWKLLVLLSIGWMLVFVWFKGVWLNKRRLNFGCRPLKIINLPVLLGLVKDGSPLQHKVQFMLIPPGG